MNKKIGINIYAILIFVAIFFIMITLNSYTTYVVDDFNNMFTQNSEKVNSIGDVISNQIYRYKNTNGRTIAHFIGGLILMMDKYVINLMNTLVFMLFIYLIYKFSHLHDYFGIDINNKNYLKVINRNKYGRHEYKALFVLISFLSIWYFTPVFGQDFLWVMGSANYLWTSVILLIILHMIRRDAVLKNNLESVLLTFILIILSFISGWTNENSVPSMIIIISYYIYIMYKNRMKGVIFPVLMLVSIVTGFLVMITAPGNYIRMSIFQDNNSEGFSYFTRLSGMNENFVKYLFVLFLIALIFLVIARVFYTKKSWESEMYFVAGIASYYSMIFAPTFPPRAMVCSVFFFIISIIMSISVIGRINIKIGTGILFIIFVLLGYQFYSTFPSAVLANKEYHKKYSAREIVIIDSRTFGKVENIEVPPLTTDNTYVAAYGLEDVKENTDDWVNFAISRYYGVRSIKLRK